MNGANIQCAGALRGLRVIPSQLMRQLGSLPHPYLSIRRFELTNLVSSGNCTSSLPEPIICKSKALA